MKKIFALVFGSIFLFSTIAFSQQDTTVYESSIIVSFSLQSITNDLYEYSYNTGNKELNFKSKETLYSIKPFALHYSGKFIYSKNIIEIRPGLISNEAYRGIELGLFYHRTIYDFLSVFGGINMHINNFPPIVTSDKIAIERGCFFNPTLGINVNLYEPFSFIISYEYLNREKIFSDHYINPHGPSTQEYRYINWLVKLGIAIKLNNYSTENETNTDKIN